MKSNTRLWPMLVMSLALSAGTTGAWAADTAPAPVTTDVQAPAATPGPAKMLVALVVSDELKSSKWGEKSWGGKGVNNLSDAIVSHATAMLSDMGDDARTVTPSDRIEGAQYYVTPVIKRAEQAPGTFAWSKDRYTLALEWRVTDAKGATILLDTVVGEGTAAGGNTFTAHDQAIKIFKLLMDDTCTKSRALLTPVLVRP